jgi:hypothetical protein
MSKIEELFDSILVLATRFPLTLFRLFFMPTRAFDASNNCSPGMFLTIVLLFSYVLLQASAVSQGKELPKWFDKDILLLVTIAYFSILVTIQRAVLGKLFAITKTPDEQARVLFYPVAVAVLVLVLVSLIEIQMPGSVITRIVVSHCAYCWLLFNVSRAYFLLSLKQSVCAVIVGYGTLMLIPAAISALYWLRLHNAA